MRRIFNYMEETLSAAILHNAVSKHIAIEFAKWIKTEWRIEKGRYRHRGDFYKNTKKLPDEEQLWKHFIKVHPELLL